MARPRKCRRICQMPKHREFGPHHCHHNLNSIIMAMDEYEAIRLIDHEGLQQSDCAAQMGVARSTVQAIYLSARQKLAMCLVEGNPLVIEGGDVEICGQVDGCPKQKGMCQGHCPRHKH